MFKSIFVINRYHFIRLTVCFLLFILATANAQESKIPEKTVSGRILDSLTKKPIVDVIVVNKTTNKTTLSNADGFFYIKANVKDTLIFYLIGYFAKVNVFKTPEDFNKQVLVFFLKPNIEELREIEITAQRLKPEEKFPFNQTPATAFSPISFLYERYSKKYKQYRKIEAMEKEKYYQYLREARFSKQLVIDITGIPKEEADDFMKVCKFSEEFLLNASDYDFIVAVKKKYQYYAERR